MSVGRGDVWTKAVRRKAARRRAVRRKAARQEAVIPRTIRS